MIIKKANKNNLTEITNLLLKELKKPPFNENYNFKDAKKSIEFYYNLGKMFIAKENKQIIGVIIFKIEIWFEGKVILIEDLMVDSSSKNKNIKDQLLNKLEDYSFKNKIKSITFLTHKKDNSLSYYRKKGFNKEYHIISMRKDIF